MAGLVPAMCVSEVVPKDVEARRNSAFARVCDTLEPGMTNERALLANWRD